MDDITFKRREDLEQFVEMRQDIKVIKEILEKNNVPQLTADIKWLKQGFNYIAGIVAGIIVSVVGLFLRGK